MSDNTDTPTTVPDTEPMIPAAPEDPPAAPLSDAAPPQDAAPTEKPADTPKEPEYTFKDLPEGFDTKEILEFAKAQKLSPEAAQKVLERDFATADRVEKAVLAEVQKRADAERAAWRESVLKDPKLGGEHLQATRATVMNVWQKLPVDLQKEIHKANVAEHPILIRVLHTLGGLMAEDKLKGPTQNTPAPKQSSWEQLFTDKTPTR